MGSKFERFCGCGHNSQIIFIERLKQNRTHGSRMCDIELTYRFCYDISDGLVVTTRLIEVERHQRLDIVAQTFRLAIDDFSQCAQEHVLLLRLRLPNHVEYLLEEVASVANCNAAK